MNDKRQTNELRILKDCRDLFKYTHELCKINQEFKYTLNQQIIRSCISIGSNIAEGNKRSFKEFLHFIKISLGSLEEYQFQISLYPNITNLSEILDLSEKIKASILNLRKSLIVGR